MYERKDSVRFRATSAVVCVSDVTPQSGSENRK